MKVLVFGADGFIGRAVIRELIMSHEVIGSTAKKTDPHHCDLSDRKSVTQLLLKEAPKVIINCAGVVENTEKAQLNVDFTMNILHAITDSGVSPDRVIIMGSAAEYGVLNSYGLTVSEDEPRNPVSLYGKAKKAEVDKALAYAENHGLTVVVARLFNPLGSGMRGKFLVGNVLEQVREVQKGTRKAISINRHDAMRDYVDIRDVASAIGSLVDAPLSHNVYNIGSGWSTSNLQIVNGLLELYGLQKEVTVQEAEAKPELPFAAEAGITRITTDTGWVPRYTFSDTLRSIKDGE